jgi:hypothetical protein
VVETLSGTLWTDETPKSAKIPSTFFTPEKRKTFYMSKIH